MKWTDSLDIALDLIDEHPDVDPTTLRFTELRDWVLNLENFDDKPEHCGENSHEAIQMYWIEEIA
jgi:FeS assembly protein IscX